ncbi:YggT family protein [Propionibacteriaceae bacterium G1746]|uniref:YggT family protein n=1 Tax=Aestuariimicrobium sp. G57 TaxID=3418485 RepID=UPI003C24E969
MGTVGWVLGIALEVYMFLFFVRMVMSFVPLLSPGFTPRGLALVAFEAVYTVTDPLIRFYDRWLPALRFGQVSISLGFICAWITLLVTQRLVLAYF